MESAARDIRTASRLRDEFEDRFSSRFAGRADTGPADLHDAVDLPPAPERPQLRERSAVAVARLRNRFADIDGRLREAHCEIARLEGELARWRARYRAAQRIDVPYLRRQVAYYCHPDRGGDGSLMTSLNVAFDFLERLQQPSFEFGGSGFGS